MNLFRTIGVLSSLLIGACAMQPTHNPAPIVERTQAASRPAQVVSKTAPEGKGLPVAKATDASSRNADDDRPLTHTVKKGDTLYSLALEYGLDYKEVASWNQVGADYLIKIDQVLRLTAPESENGAVVIKPLKPEPTTAVKVVEPKVETLSTPKLTKPTAGTDANLAGKPADGAASKPVDSKVTESKPAETKPVLNALTGDEEISNWAWPTQGKVITPFSDLNKGIDINGKLGQAVHAAGPGKVVYAGTGLRGLGKLVIIKHNKTYLSAYAHNNQLLVKEGDVVKKGDKIAEMGNTDAEQVKLHFEIRRYGKPVDPTKYLTAEKT